MVQTKPHLSRRLGKLIAPKAFCRLAESLFDKKGILYSVLTLIKAILTICIIYIESTSLLYIWLIYIVVYFIIDMLVMNKFYKKVYKNSEIFTVFTIITFGLLKPIFIYTTRIKKISKYQ